jgi:hypothetical protein
MFIINKYTDLLAENITQLSVNTGIVSCAEIFVKDIQDENVEVVVFDKNHFELKYELNGQNYILRCNKINGKVGITGFYRSGSSEDDIIDLNVSPLDALRCLNVRNLYNCTIEKIVRILKSCECDSQTNI